jgi:uncharacterized membrane protein YgaE (UPF0421/DUF939 family)
MMSFITKIKNIKTKKEAEMFIKSIDFPKKEFYNSKIRKTLNDSEAIKCLYSIALDLEGMAVSEEKDSRYCRHHDRKQGWWD